MQSKGLLDVFERQKVDLIAQNLHINVLHDLVAFTRCKHAHEHELINVRLGD